MAVVPASRGYLRAGLGDDEPFPAVSAAGPSLGGRVRAVADWAVPAVGMVACFGIALAYLAVAAYILFDANIGHPVAAMDATHGIDTGDLFAMPFVGAALGCVVLASWFLHEQLRCRSRHR